MKSKLENLKKLLKLNYSLIFDKCFYCGESKNGRLLFCSLSCLMKTWKDS